MEQPVNQESPETADHIGRLHSMLRHNPENPRPLHVYARPAEDQMVLVRAGNSTTLIPAGGERRDPEEVLRFMLSHYPEPAFINGEEVERHEFRETPAITRIVETGFFAHSRLKRTELSEQPGATVPRGLILSEGLTYLNGHSEGNRRKTVLPAEPLPGGRNQIRNAEFWEASPNIKLSVEEASQAEYTPDQSGYPACRAAAKEKIREQLNQAERVIRENLPSAPPKIQWRALKGLTADAGLGAYRTWHPSSSAGALVFPDDRQIPAVPDLSSCAGQSAVYSMARALLQNPDADIIPVAQHKDAAAQVNCEKATVKWSDGKKAVFEGDDLDNMEDLIGFDEDMFTPARACAESIIITAVLNIPGQQPRTVEAPADFLRLSQQYEGVSWIAVDRWKGKSPQEIADVEIQALTHEDSEDNEWEIHQTRQNLATWWTRALEGENSAFNRELQRLAQEFHPQSAKPQEPRTALDGAGGAALTWRPQGTWDWLDEAIREAAGGSTVETAELKRITEAVQEELLRTCAAEIRAAAAKAVKVQ